jgi:hypothetical protein
VEEKTHSVIVIVTLHKESMEEKVAGQKNIDRE